MSDWLAAQEAGRAPSLAVGEELTVTCEVRMSSGCLPRCLPSLCVRMRLPLPLMHSLMCTPESVWVVCADLRSEQNQVCRDDLLHLTP